MQEDIQPTKKYRFTIRVGIVLVFVSIFLAMSFLIISLVAWRSYANAVVLTNQVTSAIATSIFGAQAIGAGQTDQLRRIVRTGLVMNLVITGALVAVAYLFSQHLVALFITSPEVIEITETLLHIVLWSVVMFGFSAVLSGMMRASGDVFIPMLLSLGTILLVETPLALYLSTTSLGLNGIWTAYSVSFTMMLVVQGAYYWFVWKNKPIKKLI